MHPHHDAVPVANLPPHERDVRFAVDEALVRKDAEGPMVGGQCGGGHPPDQALGLHAVPDQVLDRDHQQAVAPREPRELRHPRHRPVVVHDLADDTGGIQAGNAGQIDGRLGLTGAHQHAARPRAQGKHVTRAGEVRRLGGRIDRGQHRHGAIGRRDAGARAGLRLDRHAERGVEARRVLRHHERHVELGQPLGRHGQADESPAVARHEVDRLGRDLFRRDRQVALVLAVLVIHDDDHATLANRLDGVLHGREGAPAARGASARCRRPGIRRLSAHGSVMTRVRLQASDFG